jgi:hypothetical protein
MSDLSDVFAGEDGSVWERVPDDDPDQLMVLRELSRQLREEAAVHLEALREAREIIAQEFSGDPTEPWRFIDEAIAYRAQPKES